MSATSGQSQDDFAPFFGAMGTTAAMALAAVGAAYGTAKAGTIYLSAQL